MQWFHEYPRSALFVGAVILVSLGIFAVARKSPVEISRAYSNIPNDTALESAFFDYTAPPTERVIIRPIPPSLMQTVASNPPFEYVSPFITQDSKTVENATLSNPSPAEVKKTPSVINNAGFWSPFSFTPRGLISASIPTKTRTLEEKVLFDYGNELGSYIVAFDDTHQNTVSMFQDFFSTRGAMPAAPAGELKKGAQPKPAPPPADGGNPSIEGILATAKDYSRLADTIANMSAIPKEAQALHIALVQGYKEIGAGLSAIVATDTGNLAKAVTAYNESADKFIKNFVALADFFGARGIKFSSSDPGNVFSFTGQSL